MTNLLESAFYLGLGATSMTAKKAKEFVDKAVANSSISKEEGKQLIDTMIAEGQKAQQTLNDKICEIIHSKGASLLPQNPQIDELKTRIEQLEAKIDELTAKLSN